MRWDVWTALFFTSSVCGNMSSASSVCGNLSMVTASALHQQTRICQPNCFLISAFTLSKSLQVKIGISRLISSMLLSHHLNLSSNSISSSSKRFWIALAGFPTTFVYGGTSLPTTLFAPMIAPSPMWTPGRITEFCPIQTSFSITVSPRIISL